MPNSHGNCLTCKHAFYGWDEEIGGEKYLHQIEEETREDEDHENTISCTLNPKWTEVSVYHWCGQFFPAIFREVENEIWGTWKEQEWKKYQEENKSLKRRLDKANATVRKLRDTVARAMANGKIIPGE